MTTKISVFAISLLLGCFAGTTQAHNNYFLPGDSFFSVSISRDVIKKWMENSEPEFEFQYSRFDGQFMACGNIGYTKLKVVGIDASFRSALSEAYWRYSSNERPLYRLEGDNPNELSQVNGIVALIYNADFEGPLGLKLNEDWQAQGAGRYCGLFETAQPVVADWKHGSMFPPLKLDVDLAPLRHLQFGGEGHRTMDTQLTVTAKNLKMAIVGFASQDGYSVMQTCPNLQRIYDDKDRTEYVTVDPKGMTTFSCNENGLWKEDRIEMPVSKRNSRIPTVGQDDAFQPATAVEAKTERPNLVGTWLNEGELCSLTVRKDGTCAMVTHIPEDGTIERIQGTWTQQGRTLTVNLKEKWRGGRTKTYYFNRKNWGEENWQDLLMIKYKGEEQFQFYRVND